jgi:hypothetical protein
MPTLRSTTLINLVICGDPATCKALVLVLQGPNYNARFVCTSSLNDVRTLQEVEALLLAPRWATEGHGGSWSEFGELMSAMKMPILELVGAFEERGERPSTSAWPARRDPWPCSTDELKRHIRAAIARTGVRQTTNKPQVQDVGEGQEQARL